jgi:hypothetical protein
MNIIFDILKDPTIFNKGCLIKFTYHDNINTTKILFFKCFMDFSLLFITLNILAPTTNISSITTSCNYSYRHVNLFNESDDKFGKLDKDCWTCMFNVKCIVKPSILKVTLPIDAINKHWFSLSYKICFYCIIVIILELQILMYKFYYTMSKVNILVY